MSDAGALLIPAPVAEGGDTRSELLPPTSAVQR
jgi:hypothetical protein